MKKTLALFVIYNLSFTLCWLSGAEAKAQNIGINGTGVTAHPSALLDIDAVATPSLGILIPRIALQAINIAMPVTSPATSLLVYNTATASTGTNAVSAGYYYWDGTKWVRFAYNASGSFGDAWATLGNAGTNSTINFLGTTDAQDLAFRTNNLEAVRIGTAGNIGIGIAPVVNAFVITQKTIGSNFTPAGYYFKQNDLYNTSTFNSTGNVNASLNRLINTASGTMSSAGSIIGTQNEIVNQGTFNNTINAYGAYNTIFNSGTFSVTNVGAGTNNLIDNQAGRTMRIPFARGSINYINNSGTFTGTSAIGMQGSLYNASSMNTVNEIHGSLSSVENNVGGTMNSPSINGAFNFINNSATLNANEINANNSIINLLASSTTSVIYANALRGGIENFAGSNATLSESKGGFIYFNNSGNLTMKNVLAGIQTYVNNTGVLISPFIRGSQSAIFNQIGATVTNTQAIVGLFEFQNLSGSTYNSNDIIGVVNNLYNKGTITSPYYRAGYFNSFNDVGGVINASKEFSGGHFVASNKGSIPNTRYFYGGSIELYNKGTIVGDYQRGATIGLTNDTLGSITSYTNYTALLVENINRATLNATEMTGLNVNTFNTPTSNPTLQNIVGISNYVQHDGPNTITNSYGIKTDVYKSGVGNVTNAYGMYIGAVQGTNKWSIYQGDGGAPSYFAGNVGIGTTTPAEKLEITGSVKIVDGTQGVGKVLMSDAAGKGSWQSPASIRPTIVGVQSTVTSSIAINSIPTYANAYIDLPPGKWALSVVTIINLTKGILSDDEAYWIRTTFCESSTLFAITPDFQGSVLYSGSIDGPNIYGLLSGTNIINNTSGSTKRYFYWKTFSNAYGTNGLGSNELYSIGGPWGETQFVAQPVN